MGRICISNELQVSLTPVPNAASGLVPVPRAQHTRAHRARDEKCMIKFMAQLPPRIKAAAPSNTHWPQPASHAAFLNFLTWEKTSKALKGESTSPRNTTLRRQAVLRSKGRGACQHSANTMGMKPVSFPKRKKPHLSKSSNN